MADEKRSNEQPSFEENFKTLERLAQELQENKVSVDQLIPKMKEALGALRICKSVLAETKAQIKEISAEFLETGESI